MTQTAALRPGTTCLNLAQHCKHALLVTIGIKSQLSINRKAIDHVKHVAQHLLHVDLPLVSLAVKPLLAVVIISCMG